MLGALKSSEHILHNRDTVPLILQRTIKFDAGMDLHVFENSVILL